VHTLVVLSEKCLQLQYLYLVDGVQGMTDDRLGQLRDAISQTFDRRSRAVGMPYHFWSFLAIYSPEHDDYPFLRMTKIALPRNCSCNLHG
jgi:hypothetical protein